jgi:hypothetical protein
LDGFKGVLKEVDENAFPELMRLKGNPSLSLSGTMGLLL